MRKMTSNEIRETWLKYFESKGHLIVKSAPLVPINDDSLLWINAGVTPLKKYFDGSEVPKCRRLTSIQKCIRTNDVENVGVTKRHQTFFEMMGNFSVGDYFRDEAIPFAYELLTSEEYFAIPKEKLYVTVYPTDKKSYDLWVSLGIDPTHIAKLEDNFWEIGEGPCGPDSEIFYDRGEKYDPNHDALEKFMAGEDNERYMEIWNNVFSQYNSKPGEKREDYKELPSKNIDTGAGLERWCCIFQDVDSNFDTDLFTPIIKQIEEISGVLYNGDRAFKVIADHIRALTFALSDGAMFENVGRGYVLRRLLRRSVRFGKKLGIKENFMYKLVSSVCEVMGKAYPEILENKADIQALILQEEELFRKTLDAGEKKLQEFMENSTDKTISGYDAFKLYDTYGFPFELTVETLEENGYSVDKKEFDKYMEEQRNLAKSNRKTDSMMHSQNEELLSFTKESTFVYDVYEVKSNVIGLFDGTTFVKEITKEGYVVCKKTCFYAEAGGQISDTGMIIGKNFKARVLDVIKGPNGQHLHKVKVLSGVITLNEDCDMQVDRQRRVLIENNHSSVHILQRVLQEILGSKVQQAGSKVTEDFLRFDFTYASKISEDTILKVEDKVNEIINEAITPVTEELPLEEAKKLGAMALFSDKYKDKVRVVTIGNSVEFCGGTHTKNTKDIKRFAILSLENKGANVFRIEAVTGDKIEDAMLLAIKKYNDGMIKCLMKAKNILALAKKDDISLSFDVDIDNSAPMSYKDIIFNRNEYEYVSSELKKLEKEYQTKKQQKALSDLSMFEEKKETINGIETIIMRTDNYDSSVLKDVVDALMNSMQNALVFLANVKGENVNYICRSSCVLPAGYLVKQASTKTNGNGGGSSKFAQGGGKDITLLDQVLQDVKSEVEHA